MANDANIVIALDHPAIPGHFPGDPLVPGVLLLGHVLAALEAKLGPIRLHGIPQSKFLAPLRPGETCTIDFPSLGADAARFECRKGGELIARGSLRFDATVALDAANTGDVANTTDATDVANTTDAADAANTTDAADAAANCIGTAPEVSR